MEHLPRDAETIRTFDRPPRGPAHRAVLRSGRKKIGSAEHLRVGERLASELGDDLLRSRIVAFQAHLAWSASDPMRAMALSEHALALAEGGADLGLRVLAGFFLGQACHSHGDYRRGVTVLTDTLERLPAEMVGERFGMGLPASVVVPRMARVLSRRHGALRRRAGAGRGGRADHPGGGTAGSTVTTTCGWPSESSAARQGDLDAAIPSLEGAVELARHGNLQLMVTSGLGWLAEGYLQAGRASEAAAALEESLSASGRDQVRRVPPSQPGLARRGAAPDGRHRGSGSAEAARLSS